ncbi:ABC transporter ATP-binding protein [Rufibacter sp. DG15C]|uniref:ABC transporter ATP-binding protein n=1 Tax=Rufibacter sp. DG15C TaxID=1379909 RepID=UPI00078E6516|nr:ABC transporter ATP-binding protein [Rufibacter sp. DG15C]AMM52521.1 ABC transporter ATP-binding protein [Rufibacter sp. DG15C]
MIHIENLSFGYKKDKLLFHNLNLILSRGHIYGLLGKNGAGKSSLLKNMVGLAFPQQGTCLVQGYTSSDRLPSMLENVFFLPEEFHVPSLSTKKYVHYTAPFYPSFDYDAFYSYLKEFEVPSEAVLSDLSFGQQKKMMIAFGLAANTDLLVLDEPTNGLDIPSKVQFRKLIAGALTLERCIVISTHQVRDLDSLIDTVVILHDREVVVNQEMDTIAEKLLFTTVPTSQGVQVLYAEESVRGITAILPNPEGAYSRVDLELLFNGIISGNKEITQILNTSHYAPTI